MFTYPYGCRVYFMWYLGRITEVSLLPLWR
jgi:hypothetical protein